MLPDALVAGGATFVALATGIILAFMSGKIVAGSTFDRLAGQVDRLVAGLERKNDIDEAVLREWGPNRERRA